MAMPGALVTSGGSIPPAPNMLIMVTKMVAGLVPNYISEDVSIRTVAALSIN